MVAQCRIKQKKNLHRYLLYALGLESLSVKSLFIRFLVLPGSNDIIPVLFV